MMHWQMVTHYAYARVEDTIMKMVVKEDVRVVNAIVHVLSWTMQYMSHTNMTEINFILSS